MKGVDYLVKEIHKDMGEWKVKDLMTDKIITIGPDKTMEYAVNKMKEYEIHGLIVTDKKKTLGIVTTYDALSIMARREYGGDVLVRDVMSTELISTHPEKDVIDALEIMLQEHILRLPVIDKGEVVGILSTTDLVNAFDKGFHGETPAEVMDHKVALTIKELMHEVTGVDPKSSVRDAANLMDKKNIGSVLITTDAKKKGIFGILTERDIFRKVVVAGMDIRTTKVSEIMSSPCHTIDSGASISAASKLFNECGIRRLPVIEKGEAIGILTVRDIVKTVALRHQL